MFSFTELRRVGNKYSWTIRRYLGDWKDLEMKDIKKRG
jgi:hypothetical protein